MLKVLIPDLPTADDLLPFLRRIDASQQYSNNGPLVQELESRLNGVCVASATLGLELAIPILFQRLRIRIPAFTFAATATAVLRAGYVPILCDVDPDTWALVEPGDDSLNVCPFGAPVFGGRLIDAASAWGNQFTGNRVYSLHATKTFGCGEGGLVCGDFPPELRKRINFGLENGLISHPGGTNAKMSEYHAAVALAQIERLPAITKKLQALEERYRQNFNGLVQMQKRPVGSYAIFPVLVPERDRVARELQSYGIETRSWYCPTLEKHPCGANLPTDGALKVAKLLSAQILCLPFHAHLTEEDVDQVCERLRGALSKRRQLRVAS